MVKLNLNLTNKNVFFTASALSLMYLIYYINVLTASPFITGGQILFYYLLIILTAFLYWFPYQFNSELDSQIGADVSVTDVVKEMFSTILNNVNFNK